MKRIIIVLIAAISLSMVPAESKAQESKSIIEEVIEELNSELPEQICEGLILTKIEFDKEPRLLTYFVKFDETALNLTPDKIRERFAAITPEDIEKLYAPGIRPLLQQLGCDGRYVYMLSDGTDIKIDIPQKPSVQTDKR